MGAGRQTQTFLTPASAGPSGGAALGPPPQRMLGKSELGGVIFGCTHVTMNECLTKRLFGLPMQHIKYVQHIRPGMCLFLFNYSGRLLHGIYEAAGDGALNIDPSAWTEGKGKTNFPAQVKFKIRQSCSPLPESVFKEAILDNYFAEVKFTFELTISQKDHLVTLFTKNMQGPNKSLSINAVSYPQKAGVSVKGWKKAGESEGEAWGKPKTFTPAIGNAWQKVGSVDTRTGATDDVKSISFHLPGKAKQETSGNSSENLLNNSKQVSDGPSDDSEYPELIVSQEADFPAFGAKTSDVKSNESDKLELDKADRKRQVLEKLQRLAPSRAEAQQEQSSLVLDKFQGLDISSADSQQRDTLSADWERHAKESATREQALLKEDRERLWVTTSAVDMNTATAFKRNLEASAGTIAQVELSLTSASG